MRQGIESVMVRQVVLRLTNNMDSLQLMIALLILGAVTFTSVFLFVIALICAHD